MKKVLFVAILFAGTTLSFAKSNMSIQNFSKSTTVRANSLEEVQKMYGICHTTVITPGSTTYTETDMVGNVWQVTEYYWDVTTYWYGC
ncbi:hypothetical protein ACP3T3_19330 [Chryseobacterium sp. CBSDS_008]|uniref:hypothetical protein n=1 Tax=Chryseobacterium sp. CBSDS_008 TaxID=3415265 RepID=UPI003CE953AF